MHIYIYINVYMYKYIMYISHSSLRGSGRGCFTVDKRGTMVAPECPPITGTNIDGSVFFKFVRNADARTESKVVTPKSLVMVMIVSLW